MKTIDILVEELPKRGGWPDGVVCFAQDVDGFFAGYKRKPTPSYGGIWTSDGYLNDSGWWSKALDFDRETAIITREQYEAALAAKNEGWIEWGGGRCPVDDVTEVDIKFLAGGIVYGVDAGKYYWPRTGQEHDIIAYRLHKPQEADQAEADDQADLNECIEHDAAPVWNGEGLPPVGCFCEVEDRDGMLVYGHGESGEVIARVENTAVIRMSYGLGCFEAGFLRPIRSEAEWKRDAAIEEMIKIATIYTTKSLSLGLALNSIYNAIAAGEIPGVKLEDL